MEVDPVLRRTVNCECEEEGTLPLLPTPKRKTALLPTPAKGRKTLLSKPLTMTRNFEIRTIKYPEEVQIQIPRTKIYIRAMKHIFNNNNFTALKSILITLGEQKLPSKASYYIKRIATVINNLKNYTYDLAKSYYEEAKGQKSKGILTNTLLMLRLRFDPPKVKISQIEDFLKTIEGDTEDYKLAPSRYKGMVEELYDSTTAIIYIESTM